MAGNFLGEPTSRQLVEAAARYLEQQLPSMTGRAAFHGRVAVNTLNIVAREMELGPASAERERNGLSMLLGVDGDLQMLRGELCAALRAGRMTPLTPGLLDHLLQTTRDRVAIEQPTYGSLALAQTP